MSTFSMKKVKTFAKETKLEFGVIAEQNYSPRKTDNRKISASEIRQFKAACPIPLIKGI